MTKSSLEKNLVIHHNNNFSVIYKPENMALSDNDQSLQKAIINTFPENITLPRCGLVHRLDKDTTGLMIVAHSLNCYHYLQEKFKQKKISRIYVALVHNRFAKKAGTINQALIKNHQCGRMNIVKNNTSTYRIYSAITHYECLEEFKFYTYLRLILDTGRTHQIRAHLQYINHPVVGDQKYNRHLCYLKRQMLHAQELSFEGQTYIAKLPLDFQEVLDTLRNNQEHILI